MGYFAHIVMNGRDLYYSNMTPPVEIPNTVPNTPGQTVVVPVFSIQGFEFGDFPSTLRAFGQIPDGYVPPPLVNKIVIISFPIGIASPQLLNLRGPHAAGMVNQVKVMWCPDIVYPVRNDEVVSAQIAPPLRAELLWEFAAPVLTEYSLIAPDKAFLNPEPHTFRDIDPIAPAINADSSGSVTPISFKYLSVTCCYCPPDGTAPIYGSDIPNLNAAAASSSSDSENKI